MRCTQCGTEFEGKFCPNCGETAPSNNKRTKAVKKKKPIYKRAWFIILVIILAVSAYNKVSDYFENRPEKISWSDIALRDMLPEPESNKGKIHENSENELRVEYSGVSSSEYNDYLEACIERGYVIEAERNSTDYCAYNEKGYKLELSYDDDDDEMTIKLEKPIELNDIKWPSSELGKIIPEPESLVGKFDYESDKEFSVLIGNTPIEEYNEYVSVCMDNGFVVDYSKVEKSFYAENADGYCVSVYYEGFNTMRIVAESPSEDEQPIRDTPEDSDEVDSNGVRPDFKKAMDSYEAFMDEYVEFMKKYEKNPSDVTLLSEYAQYMSKYAQFCNDFDKWEDEEMNDAETAYYIAVQTRVNQKLVSVAG